MSVLDGAVLQLPAEGEAAWLFASTSSDGPSAERTILEQALSFSR
jgi:hypothetical protein